MKECPSCNLCFDDEYARCPDDGQTLFSSNSCKRTLSDRYILERRLGKGGMAAVFKGKHIHLKSTHAIKIISPEVVREDPTLLVRFRQEAILAASIYHPNVVNVTDFGVENEDTLFLVMEYIEGISLDEFLRKEKRLSPEKAYEILAPIALGVGVAHKKGITHRDLKPLNVMLKNGYPLAEAVKVLDFGLAKIKSTESFASLVQAKTTNLLGSPHYMSPEQWSNENIDTRSDIYSMGIILYQMLTGEVPFKGSSIPTVMYQHLQVPMPSFNSLGITVSPQIESVVQKALAKEQDQRYSTVEEFLSDYEEALSNTGNKTTKSSKDKNVTIFDSNTPPSIPASTQIYEKNTIRDFGNTYQLTYLNAAQNETLSSYFNQPKILESAKNEKLEQAFFDAQSRVEEANSKVIEAEKLAQEFNETRKAAEETRQKVLRAQQKLEEDVRRQMQAEMENKLAAEREARQKAEAEARRLLEEVKTRKEAEERANELAKNALESQQHAEEAAEAKKRYEEAKKEAENEALHRQEAELKLQKIEKEIQRITRFEAENKKIVEAQAAQQIKEQASRLEKQALEAQKTADEARLLAASEAQKREQAEAARIKAEDEARRLAEEIIEAQRRLEEAQQLAKSESEKRVVEEEARKKAEESARSSSASKNNAENLDESLHTQIRVNSVKNSAGLASETTPGLHEVSSGKILINTSSSEVSNTNQIPQRKSFNPLILAAGLFAFLLVGGFSIYLYYSFAPGSSITGNTSDNRVAGNSGDQPGTSPPDKPNLSGRLNEKMVLIKGGTFQMGRNDVNPKEDYYGLQFPAHYVTVDNFYIDRTEVTNEEYVEFVQSGHKPPGNWENSKHPAGQEKFPVTQITYEDAKDFAEWISDRNNLSCQIPSEEEWEYAARSGKQQYIYPWGNDWIPGRVNIANGESGTPTEVGTTGDETSVGGIKDMMGNVMEWTSTTFDYYRGFTGGMNPKVGTDVYKTIRGLSFAAEKEKMQRVNLLLTYRQPVTPDSKFDFLGFRLVCRPKT